MADTFKPLDVLRFIARKWWIPVLSMIIFGICALILANFLPPLYESSATFSLTIDYTETGSLSDIQEDQAMRGIGNLIASDEVIENVISEANVRSLPLSREQFKKESNLDREEFQWTIRYRSSDQLYAKDVIQIWKEISNKLIQDSLFHAQIVDSEREFLWKLEECLQLVTRQVTIDTLCGYSSTEDLIDEISIISRSINDEKIAARGLFSPLAVHIVKNPQIPLTPVRYQRNVLVFSGIVIGFLISVLFLGIVNFRRLRIEK